MKISLVQLNSINDKTANLKQIEKLVNDAVKKDRPDLIVLPEMVVYLGGTFEEKRAAAESLVAGEQAYDLFRRLAKKHKIVLHVGSLCERSGDKFYNTTVVFGRSGKELTRYRKVHLIDVILPDGTEFNEAIFYTPGKKVVTYDVDGITIGCSICYDLRFPELYRQLSQRGAQILMVPAAFSKQTGKAHWEVLCRARAIENQAYVVAPAQVGKFEDSGKKRYSWGHSTVVDPWGYMAIDAKEAVGFFTVELDLNHLQRTRAQFPVLKQCVLLEKQA